MIRIDGYWFYQVGAALRQVTNRVYEPGVKRKDIRYALSNAQQWVDNLLSQTLFRFKTSVPKGREVQQLLHGYVEAFNAMTAEEMEQDLQFADAIAIGSAISEFEQLLSAELKFADLYLITKKGAFDTTELAEIGSSIFPSDLLTKVPDAEFDAKQAARCIAFELPTAAGFHLHRLNETVLGVYHDKITGGAKRPRVQTMGKYIELFKKRGVGDPKVIAALDSLRDLHRNPLLHPRERLDTVDEALALHGAIHAVVVHMLKAI